MAIANLRSEAKINRRALLCLALALMLIAMALPSTASADPDWDYYRNITITNGSGSDLTNYPIRLHITDTTYMKDDGADLSHQRVQHGEIPLLGRDGEVGNR
ncbi:MAG: hypothetical protein JW732_09175 [Dehalococcoidia bacterium]|nr:hypothetical protein [Dehalococcoidia bacterium]